MTRKHKTDGGWNILEAFWTDHHLTTPPDILPARRDLPVNIEIPTKEEIAMSKAQTNSNKAAGPDGIPPEALKADINSTAEILHGLFAKIWREEVFPQDWKEGHLVKLPMEGDLTSCNNYRGITLLSIPGKVFNRILLNRIKDAVDAQLRYNQVVVKMEMIRRKLNEDYSHINT